MGPRKHVLDGGAHWRNLANTIEPSMCGGDASFVSSYFEHALVIISVCELCDLISVVPPVGDRLVERRVVKPDHVKDLSPAMFTYPVGET